MFGAAKCQPDLHDGLVVKAAGPSFAVECHTMLERPTIPTSLFQALGRTARDEDGAVTVDFVVLCAAVVTIGLMAANAIYPTVESAAKGIKPTTTAATGG